MAPLYGPGRAPPALQNIHTVGRGRRVLSDGSIAVPHELTDMHLGRAGIFEMIASPDNLPLGDMEIATLVSKSNEGAFREIFGF